MNQQSVKEGTLVVMPQSQEVQVAPQYRPLVLTLWFPTRTFERFQALRKRHYPFDRNTVPAHVTLFHHLPGLEFGPVVDRLKLITRGTRKPRIDVTGIRSLGRGVAYELHSPDLASIRDELAHAWHGLLVPQDQFGWRPHVTVQNKVEPRDAKLLLARLQAEFSPWSFDGEGLLLWRYLDGPWEKLREFRFVS